VVDLIIRATQNYQQQEKELKAQFEDMLEKVMNKIITILT
jgi:hypothetical protein